MALESIEAAQALLTQIVLDFVSQPRYRDGAYGAVIGAEVARRGLKGFHQQFRSNSLADFIREHCRRTLSLRQATNQSDFVVTLMNQGTGSTVAVPSKSFRVDPRIWSAVLSPGAPDTYITSSGVPAVGAQMESDGSIKIERMPVQRQAAVLSESIPVIAKFIEDADLQKVMLEALENAKGSDAPILGLSRMMTALYLVSQDWNTRRINAVSEFVKETSGVQLQPSGPATPFSRPRTFTERKSLGYEMSQPTHPTVTVAVKQDSSELREAIKRAIDRMNYRDLLDLRLPVESIRELLGSD